MEALILIVDMAVMGYLCWRLFRGGDGADADLGWLRYKAPPPPSAPPAGTAQRHA